MPVARVQAFLEPLGLAGRIHEFSVSSATVALAAAALSVAPARIGKSLAFQLGARAIIVVVAGDARIDNAKYKAQFGLKAKMLSPAETLARTGYAVGGVCPFDVPEDVEIYLDCSLRRFATVFPAAGSGNSAVELSCEELFACSRTRGWVDVCRDWQDTDTDAKGEIDADL